MSTLRVGEFRAAQQRQPKHVAIAGMSVLAVVQQSHAKARLRQVHPAVRRHLEHSPIPRRVSMRRPPNVSERDFVGRLSGTYVDREEHAQHTAGSRANQPGYEHPAGASPPPARNAA